MIRRPRRPTLFPNATLFRSQAEPVVRDDNGAPSPPPAPSTSSNTDQDDRPGTDESPPVADDDAPPAAEENAAVPDPATTPETDRKSTRLNSSHANISYAVFC